MKSRFSAVTLLQSDIEYTSVTQKEKKRNYSAWLGGRISELHINQEELAEFAGISQKTISRYACGETYPNDIDVYEKISIFVQRKALLGNYYHIDTKKFAPLLKNLLKQYKVTQQQLADAVGISQKFVSDLCSSDPVTADTKLQYSILDYFRGISRGITDTDLYGKDITEMMDSGRMYQSAATYTDYFRMYPSAVQDMLYDFFVRCYKLKQGESCRHIRIASVYKIDSLVGQAVPCLMKLIDNSVETDENGNKGYFLIDTTYKEAFDGVDECVQTLIYELCGVINDISWLTKLDRVYRHLKSMSLSEWSYFFSRFKELIQSLMSENEREAMNRISHSEYAMTDMQNQKKQLLSAFKDYSLSHKRLILEHRPAFFSDWSMFSTWGEKPLELYRSLDENSRDIILEELERVRYPSQLKRNEEKLYTLLAHCGAVSVRTEEIPRLDFSDQNSPEERALCIEFEDMLDEECFSFDYLCYLDEMRFKNSFDTADWYIWMLFEKYYGIYGGITDILEKMERLKSE